MTTLERIKIAFRKLKASVYFDKTTLPLRDKVVEFETSSDFEDKLRVLADAVDAATLNSNLKQMKSILSSINVLPFPKNMVKIETDDKNIINVGNPKEKPVIEEIQHFIDMDVCGHILGILWIMTFGKRLDEKCYVHSFGNRLRKNLIWDEDSEEVKDSPALFEPYFSQYSRWRDGGLKCAEGLLKEGYDTLILTLDLKRFYYNTGITREVFDKLLDELFDGDVSDCDRSLHSAVFAIMKRYTEVLNKNKVENNGIVLPIGFLPSSVLSNWCLLKFDQGILDFWNPNYYGRYVDDIIIVEKIEKGSEIYKQARSGDVLSKDYIIDYFLGGKRNHNSRWFVKKDDTINQSVVDCDSPKVENNSNKVEEFYTVNSVFSLSAESRFVFKPDKSRIITLFAENNSVALIKKFKKEIYENVSEFRLMPEIGEAFSQDDFDQFYRLDNDATVNKLRGVKNIKIDKYELSKFLGKYRVVSSLVDDGNNKKFTRIIGKMFNYRELVDYYILWERILEIFITDKDYSGFAKFVKRIDSAIKTISLDSKITETTDAETVQNALIRHLYSVLNRTLSLLWGDGANTCIPANVVNKSDIALRGKYLRTYMSNKYIAAVPIDIIKKPAIGADVNFTDFTDAFVYLEISGNVRSGDNVEYEYLPYFMQAQDISISMYIRALLSEDNDSHHNADYIDIIRRDDEPQVSLDDERTPGVLISVNDNPLVKMRIAVANVNVSKVYNMDSVLKGRKPNRTNDRYKALAKIVNTAIKEKADMLVLPENFVPFEWLLPLSAKAAREGLSIIAGVEHVIFRDNVYNLTAVILPFKYFKTVPSSAIFFQLKKFYSPEEKHLIEGYYKNVPVSEAVRPLYNWRDCYFPVYCCYELAVINERSKYLSWADMIIAVECNKDTVYFSSIVESLVRDMHCYCVQVNTSEYGDSRITSPTESVKRNILTVKGGENQTLLIGEVDIKKLREFQIKHYTLQKGGEFKPTPPGIDTKIVKQKLEKRYSIL